MTNGDEICVTDDWVDPTEADDDDSADEETKDTELGTTDADVDSTELEMADGESDAVELATEDDESEATEPEAVKESEDASELATGDDTGIDVLVRMDEVGALEVAMADEVDGTEPGAPEDETSATELKLLDDTGSALTDEGVEGLELDMADGDTGATELDEDGTGLDAEIEVPPDEVIDGTVLEPWEGRLKLDGTDVNGPAELTDGWTGSENAKEEGSVGVSLVNALGLKAGAL